MLAVNAWDEDADTLRGFVRSKNLKHRILLDGSDVFARYRAPGLPIVLWIDRDGVVQDLKLGLGSAAALEAKTRRLLKSR